MGDYNPALFVLRPVQIELCDLTVEEPKVVLSDWKTHKAAQTYVRGNGLEHETRGYPTTRGVDALTTWPPYPHSFAC